MASNIVREELGGNRKDTKENHDMFREAEINWKVINLVIDTSACSMISCYIIKSIRTFGPREMV